MKANDVAKSEPLGFHNSQKDELNLLNDENGTESLSEDVLLHLSRNLVILTSEAGEVDSYDALRRLRSLLDALLRTAKSPRLSATHRASACNALCGFLEHGIASSNSELRTLCFSASTWNEIFDVFIERSEDAKSKPMRQVLVTLVKVLSRNPNSNAICSIKDAAVGRLLTILHGEDRLSSAKPAMQGLEHFISKKTISISDFLLRLVQVRGAEHASKCPVCGAAQTSCSGNCQNLGYALLSPYVSRSEDSIPLQQSPWTSAIQGFVWCVLNCILVNSDLAPMAGRLLSSFLTSLQLTVTEVDQYGDKLDTWIRPVHRFIKKHPDLIELFIHHILPDLLRMDSTTSTAFLEVLPLDDLRRGITGCLDTVDIQIYLMALRAREEFGPMPYKDGDNSKAPTSDSSLFHRDSTELFLLHASPSVRLAALIFATSSRSTTELIPTSVLSTLRDGLPQFHAEGDAKSRNEFLNLMRMIFTRLRGGLAQMYKNRIVSQSLPPAEVSKNSIKPVEESSNGRNSSHILIEYNIRFLRWYIVFLRGELLPTASYPRHITTLKVLHLLLQMGLYTCTPMDFPITEAKGDVAWKAHVNCSNGRIVRLLLDLLMDPFDDVRNMAVIILKLGALHSASLCHNLDSGALFHRDFDGDLIKLQSNHQIEFVDARGRAQDMMHRTGRADHADGAGRFSDLLYLKLADQKRPNVLQKCRVDMLERLLFDLEASIRIAKENLRMAVLKTPLHGHLIALRYIVSQPSFFQSLTESGDVQYARWRKIHDSISLYCTEIWQAVKEVLCVDSPEGHTGEDFEEDDLDIGVKDTLSFSWRALKEASALQHAIIMNETYGPPQATLGLQCNDLRAIGGLAFTQLAELRHRGAFSTVSQTFAACCTRCIKTQDAMIAALPEDWYQDALSCIHEKATTLTRRSAGIPAMITGVLAAHPSKCFLENVMLDMQAISDAPVEGTPGSEVLHLPQVHAMNCLKDIFTNTQLGRSTEPYIADTLDIAAGCLENDVWAIQNCGMMLLKALLNRLLGKNEASNSSKSGVGQKTSSLLYEKFPNLPDLIVKLLQPGSPSIDNTREPPYKHGSKDTPQAQKVFPALEIIQRAGMPLKHRSITKILLRWHLGSTVWYIRKKTAKTISIVTDASRCQDEIIELLQELWQSQNDLHGRLLCVRELLLKASDTVHDTLGRIIQPLLRLFRPVALQNGCPFTITAYMDIIKDLLRSPTLAIQVTSGDKRRFYDLEYELWRKNNKYVRSPMEEDTNLAGRSISRYNLLAAHHLLDTIGPVDGDQSAAIPKLVRELAKGDPDVLHALVTDFEEVYYQWTCQRDDGLDFRVSFLLSIIREVPVQDIKAIAMSKLGSILSSFNITSGSAEYKSLSDFAVRPESLFDWDQGSVPLSPQLADGELRLRGAVLSALTRGNLNSATNTYSSLLCGTKPIETWIRMLRLGGNEGNESHIRLAAAASIEGFQTTLRPGVDRATTRPEFLGVYLVLYDVLNDDDADIREKGASIVSWVLSDASSFSTAGLATLSLSHLAAKSRLSGFLIAQYNNSAALCKEAVGRLTGVSTVARHFMLPCNLKDTGSESAESGHDRLGTQALELPNVRLSLREARKEDTALFVEEKQNLYIDEVQEANHWARFITKLSSSAIDGDSAHKLEVWALQGLAALTEMAEAEIDGPLGWTTKPEVCTLGVRIIYAVEVILHWAGMGIASVLEGEIREALAALHRVGEKSLLHSLWLQCVENSLQGGT